MLAADSIGEALGLRISEFGHTPQLKKWILLSNEENSICVILSEAQHVAVLAIWMSEKDKSYKLFGRIPDE